MLTGRPTKYGSGREIFGDYWDLKSLYITLHRLAGDEGAPGNILLMSLAYEVRKANANVRETEFFEFDEELLIYRGFKMFWTEFLVTVKLMRERSEIKAMVITSEMQSDIYRLEPIVESSLKTFDSKIGAQIYDWLMSCHFLKTEYIELFVERITFLNLQSKDGKPRFKQLWHDLEMLLPKNYEHKQFKKHIMAESKRLNCEK